MTLPNRKKVPSEGMKRQRLPSLVKWIACEVAFLLGMVFLGFRFQMPVEFALEAVQ